MSAQRREKPKGRFWTKVKQLLKLKVSNRLVSGPSAGVRATAKCCRITKKQMEAGAWR